MPITLIDEIVPKNNGTFAMVKAQYVEMSDGTRLNAQPIIKIVSALPADAADHPNVLYIVLEEGGGTT